MANVSSVLKPETHDESFDIGLGRKYRADMAGDLSGILAASYRLTIKSHVYHWNVVGPLFKPLHELTEEHYTELFQAVDVIAERIRALGHVAPAKIGDTANFAPEKRDVDHGSAQAMVEDMIADHEEGVRIMRKAAVKADEAGDVVTADMLTERLTFHEKALWMLRSIIAT